MCAPVCACVCVCGGVWEYVAVGGAFLSSRLSLQGSLGLSFKHSSIRLVTHDLIALLISS